MLKSNVWKWPLVKFFSNISKTTIVTLKIHDRNRTKNCIYHDNLFFIWHRIFKQKKVSSMPNGFQVNHCVTSDVRLGKFELFPAYTADIFQSVFFVKHFGFFYPSKQDRLFVCLFVCFFVLREFSAHVETLLLVKGSFDIYS